MPVIGYFLTDLVAGAFQSVFQKIASWVSFSLLAFLGGKMVLDCVLEWRKQKKHPRQVCEEAANTEAKCERLPIGKLFAQAIATSIDALAVGVTLCMKAVSGKLLLGVWWATGMIGIVTFALSVVAVYIGKAVGDKLADKATLAGGVVLMVLAIKMLF
jgi:putative Mn2+ efflux pump MntP